MRKHLCPCFILLVALFLFSTCSIIQGSEDGNAQTPQSEEQSQEEVKKQMGRGWSAEYTREGRICALRGGEISSKGDPVESCHAFLRSRASLLQLHPALADLKTERVVVNMPCGSDVFFSQVYEGIPVVNGGVSCHFNSRGNIFLIYSGYIPSLKLITAPLLSAGEAFGKMKSEERASLKDTRRVKALDSLRLRSSRPVIWAKEGKGLRAWEIIALGATPLENMKYYLDASTGAILYRTRLTRTASGWGKVIFPHPISKANTMSLRKTAGEAAFAPLYTTVPLLDITLSGGSYSLSGPYVVIKDIESPVNTPPALPGNIFNYPVTYYNLISTDHNFDNYDDVFCYWLIDTSQRYIQSLGFQNACNYPIECDSHGTDDAFNAFYSPDGSGKGFITFGSNGDEVEAFNDLAEDATVVLHEYGHAIQDNQLPNGFEYDGAAGGILEGFADYWSCSSCYDANVANGFPPSYQGTWAWKDCDDTSSFCRDLNAPNMFPGDFDSEPHKAGKIWGPALWDLLESLGRDVADRLILRSNTLMPPDGCSSFDDAVQAVLDADTAIYGGIHHAALKEAFNARGIGLFTGVVSYSACPYEWIEASGGTRVSFLDPDLGMSHFPMPFDFSIMGYDFPAGSPLYVTPDGTAHFAPPIYNESYFVWGCTTAYLFLNKIWGTTVTSYCPLSLGPCVEDLVVGGFAAPQDAGVFYTITGTAPERILTIQWNKAAFRGACDDPAAYTGIFEINLYEGSNLIRFQYHTMTFGSAPDCDNGKTATAMLYLDYRRNTVLNNKEGKLLPQSAYLLGRLPDAPSNLSATLISRSQIELTWTDTSADEQRFIIESESNGSGTFTRLGETGENVTHFTADSLEAGTTYTFRVKAESVIGSSTWSNTASAATPGNGGNKSAPGSSAGGGCFIATAAYGSYLDPHVMVLRKFRDNVLLESPTGKKIVSLYYEVSPPIACMIENNELLKAEVRLLLAPVVYGLECGDRLLYLK